MSRNINYLLFFEIEKEFTKNVSIFQNKYCKTKFCEIVVKISFFL